MLDLRFQVYDLRFSGTCIAKRKSQVVNLCFPLPVKPPPLVNLFQEISDSQGASIAPNTILDT